MSVLRSAPQAQQQLKLQGHSLNVHETLLFFGTFNPPHWGHWQMQQAAVQQGGFQHVVWVPAGRPPNRLKQAPSATAYLAEPLVAAPHRLALLQHVFRAAKAYDKLQGKAGQAEQWICDWELRQAQLQNEPTFTIQTLLALLAYPSVQAALEQSPKQSLNLLMGADTLASLPTWFEASALARLCTFWVAQRPSQQVFNLAELQQQLGTPVRAHTLNLPEVPVAATAIREALARCHASDSAASDIVANEGQGLAPPLVPEALPMPKALEGLCFEAVWRYATQHHLYS